MRFVPRAGVHGPAHEVGVEPCCGPFFGDQIATLTLDGRSARVRFEKAGSDPHEDADLATVAELTLS